MNPDVQSIAQMAQHLQQSQVDHDSPNGLKRKADDEHGGSGQQRARRNRYVSIACNECKRRKIKCNGQTPCQRCGNLHLECIYAPNCCSAFKDSQEYKDMAAQIAMLQDHVSDLYSGLNILREQIGQPLHVSQQQSAAQGMIDPSLQSNHNASGRSAYISTQSSPAPIPSMSPSLSRPKSQPHSSQSIFKGPTSAEYNFGVAQSSLQAMGIMRQGDTDHGRVDGPDSRENTPDPVATALRTRSSHGALNNLPLPPGEKDPIWSIAQEEALRLCRVYEDEMGLMYPILDTEKIVEYVNTLYRFMDAAKRAGLMVHGFPGADALDDEDTNILKLVLATAMTVEACGRSEVGQKLFDCVQPAIDQMLLGSVGIKGIRLLAMAAMYEFHRDDEGTSWRLIGLTARVCIELGLHRRETYDAIKDDAERTETILLFWAIYVLDRRWSFGTGMPFALQDGDIDPQLPKPDDNSQYLSAMIQYSAIGSKVWRTINTTPSPNQPLNTEEMNYLDYQVLQWLRNIPASLRFDHPSQSNGAPSQATPPQSRAEHRLRILLYLRANAMRIHIHRKVLHSATSIMQHREQAQTVVNVAKDTIRVLTHINQTSDLYRTQQVLFNAFLTSALAVLFLSVSHTPALFADQVREEFFLALDLVRGFSKGSWVSKRLWKTIRVLKDFGPKLGLATIEPKQSHATASTAEDFDQSRSAAVAMAGLAGHNVDEMALYNGQHAPAPPGSWSAGPSGSPEHMVHDLTSLFEAAGSYQSGADGSGGHPQDGSFNTSGGNGNAASQKQHAMDEGLSNILKELF